MKYSIDVDLKSINKKIERDPKVGDFLLDNSILLSDDMREGITRLQFHNWHHRHYGLEKIIDDLTPIDEEIHMRFYSKTLEYLELAFDITYAIVVGREEYGTVITSEDSFTIKPEEDYLFTHEPEDIVICLDLRKEG